MVGVINCNFVPCTSLSKRSFGKGAGVAVGIYGGNE